jgi:hypothetical protein
MHVTAHGEMGVRQCHARDDSKILAHLRKGILELPDIDDHAVKLIWPKPKGIFVSRSLYCIEIF